MCKIKKNKNNTLFIKKLLSSTFEPKTKRI